VTSIVLNVPYDAAKYPKDIDYDSAVCLAIRKSFLKAFLSDFRQYFEGKSVGDLGCGEALPREILKEIGIKCEYTGIDHSTRSGCGSGNYTNRPDIIWDYEMYAPADETMVFDTVLWLCPTHLDRIDCLVPYVRPGGNLIVQRAGDDLDALLKDPFALIGKKAYHVSVQGEGPMKDFYVDNVFLIGMKN